MQQEKLNFGKATSAAPPPPSFFTKCLHGIVFPKYSLLFTPVIKLTGQARLGRNYIAFVQSRQLTPFSLQIPAIICSKIRLFTACIQLNSLNRNHSMGLIVSYLHPIFLPLNWWTSPLLDLNLLPVPKIFTILFFGLLCLCIVCGWNLSFDDHFGA